MLKEENDSQSHKTVKYKRIMFGRYGLASGVDQLIQVILAYNLSADFLFSFRILF
jgi:hypothetical protein